MQPIGQMLLCIHLPCIHIYIPSSVLTVVIYAALIASDTFFLLFDLLVYIYVDINVITKLPIIIICNIIQWCVINTNLLTHQLTIRQKLRGATTSPRPAAAAPHCTLHIGWPKSGGWYWRWCWWMVLHRNDIIAAIAILLLSNCGIKETVQMYRKSALRLCKKNATQPLIFGWYRYSWTWTIAACPFDGRHEHQSIRLINTNSGNCLPSLPLCLYTGCPLSW